MIASASEKSQTTVGNHPSSLNQSCDLIIKADTDDDNEGEEEEEEEDDDDDDDDEEEEEEDSEVDEEEEEEEEVSLEEHESLARNVEQVTEPSLTPTVETPIEQSNFQYRVKTLRQIEDSGPALVSAVERSFEESSEEDDNRAAVNEGQSLPSHDEYLSDPDYHDERPGTRKSLIVETICELQTAKSCAIERKVLQRAQDLFGKVDTTSESEIESVRKIPTVLSKICNQIEESSGSDVPEESEEDSRSTESEQETEDDITSLADEEFMNREQIEEDNSLLSSNNTGQVRRSSSSESPQGEEDLTTQQQVTASEAQAELFEDELTLADDNLVSLATSQSTANQVDFLDERTKSLINHNEDNNVNSDEDTTQVASDPKINETNIERQASLDDIESLVLPFDVEAEVGTKDLTHPGKLEDNRRELIELIGDYCDELVNEIKEEALRQLELIVSVKDKLEKLHMVHRFEVGFQLNASTDEPCTMETVSNRKIYTSSMYYNDYRDSFPTIEKQVEQSRTIAKELLQKDASGISETKQFRTAVQANEPQPKSTNDGIKSAEQQLRPEEPKASAMFKRRLERMTRFTFEAKHPLTCEEEEDSWGRMNELACKVRRTRRASLEPSLLRGLGGAVMAQASNKLSGAESDGALTDTEYEAPRVKRRAQAARATTTPLSERRRRHIEITVDPECSEEKQEPIEQCPAKNPKYKPFLDSSSLKDIESLRRSSPYGEFNDHSSVSPELCRQLAEDLNRPLRSPSETNVELEAEPSNNRGARLFERRKLSSSDWIVGNANQQAPDESKTTTQVKNSSSAKDLWQSSKDWLPPVASKSARPSWTEDAGPPTIVAADERAVLEVIELAPVIVDQASQPHLGLATITKTPSFGTSSRRVIECDSPDLLTSHDDDDDEEEEDENDEENDDEGEEEEVEVNEQEPGEAASSVQEMLGQVTTKERPTMIEDAHLLSVPSRDEAKSMMVSAEEEPANGERDDDIKESVEELATLVEGRSQVVRSVSRLHHSTLLEWRPEVMTPTWMSFRPEVDDLADDGHARPQSIAGDRQRQSPPVRRRCLSFTGARNLLNNLPSWRQPESERFTRNSHHSLVSRPDEAYHRYPLRPSGRARCTKSEHRHLDSSSIPDLDSLAAWSSMAACRGAKHCCCCFRSHCHAPCYRPDSLSSSPLFINNTAAGSLHCAQESRYDDYSERVFGHVEDDGDDDDDYYSIHSNNLATNPTTSMTRKLNEHRAAFHHDHQPLVAAQIKSATMTRGVSLGATSAEDGVQQVRTRGDVPTTSLSLTGPLVAYDDASDHLAPRGPRKFVSDYEYSHHQARSSAFSNNEQTGVSRQLGLQQQMAETGQSRLQFSGQHPTTTTALGQLLATNANLDVAGNSQRPPGRAPSEQLQTSSSNLRWAQKKNEMYTASGGRVSITDYGDNCYQARAESLPPLKLAQSEATAIAATMTNYEASRLRVCIKLPHRAHKIIICRQPQLSFVTEILDIAP